MNNREITITQRLRFGMLLTAAGGFMDSYTYMTRGKVFATGQTGNYIQLAIHLMHRDLPMALHFLFPVACFFLGVFCAQFLTRSRLYEKAGHIHAVLLIEAVSFVLIGCIPETYNTLVNNWVSFLAAMQFCMFRTLGGSENYASVFCTGNMRSCAEALYQAVMEHNESQRHRAFHYGLILFSFFFGVVLGVLLIDRYNFHAAWAIALILLIAYAVFMTGKKTADA